MHATPIPQEDGERLPLIGRSPACRNLTCTGPPDVDDSHVMSTGESGCRQRSWSRALCTTTASAAKCPFVGPPHGGRSARADRKLICSARTRCLHRRCAPSARPGVSSRRRVPRCFLTRWRDTCRRKRRPVLLPRAAGRRIHDGRRAHADQVPNVRIVAATHRTFAADQQGLFREIVLLV